MNKYGIKSRHQTKFFCKQKACLTQLPDELKSIMKVKEKTIVDYLFDPWIRTNTHMCFVCNIRTAVMKLTDNVTNENRHILNSYNNHQYAKYNKVIFCDNLECLSCIDMSHRTLFTHMHSEQSINEIIDFVY